MRDTSKIMVFQYEKFIKQKPAFQISRLIRRKQRFVGFFLDFSKSFLEKKKIKQRTNLANLCFRKLFLCFTRCVSTRYFTTTYSNAMKRQLKKSDIHF